MTGPMSPLQLFALIASKATTEFDSTTSFTFFIPTIFIFVSVKKITSRFQRCTRLHNASIDWEFPSPGSSSIRPSWLSTVLLSSHRRFLRASPIFPISFSIFLYFQVFQLSHPLKTNSFFLAHHNCISCWAFLLCKLLPSSFGLRSHIFIIAHV